MKRILTEVRAFFKYYLPAIFRIKYYLHYHDTSKGLYCVDQKPEEVSKEWIDNNSFQL